MLLLYIMAGCYVAAGINHFVHPVPYIKIIPPQLPFPWMLVKISGAFEIILGILLVIQRTRRLAAAGIILLLVAVFPANIQMMINYYKNDNPYLWVTILRLPVQLLLIYFAYVYTRKR